MQFSVRRNIKVKRCAPLIEKFGILCKVRKRSGVDLLKFVVKFRAGVARYESDKTREDKKPQQNRENSNCPAQKPHLNFTPHCRTAQINPS
jgi:hypothetical protein